MAVLNKINKWCGDQKNFRPLAGIIFRQLKLGLLYVLVNEK